jgi:ribosomal protein S18 acetylase RimI-like enzyme
MSNAAPGAEFKIRAADIADAAALAHVHVAAWRETYAAFIPDAVLAALSLADRREWWQRNLSRPIPDSAVFVAEIAADDVVGFGACSRQRALPLQYRGEVLALYVLRRAQRRGIGRGLMARMANFLMDRGLYSAGLWVVRDNLPARCFYEALGGAAAGERVEQRPEYSLTEVAYGWDNLRKLYPSDSPSG